MDRHKSWIKLEPKEGENLKNYDQYYERLNNLNLGIPKEVIHQWIFPHYFEPNSTKNYAWIDLESVNFVLLGKPISFFQELNVINDNEEMVNEYQVNKFAYWHRHFWKENGTWEIPPIVLDAKSFIHVKPMTAQIKGSYQLVEGHNRLGTLKLLIREGKIPVAETHNVWVLSNK